MTKFKWILAGIGVLVVMFGLFGATLAFRYYTADVRGTVGAQERIKSPEFRIRAYQGFFDRCAAIQALEGQIDELAGTLALMEPNSRQWNITLTGLTGTKGLRHTAIAGYNGDSSKEWTDAQFKAESLPYRIPDTGYPTEGVKTVCKLS